MTSNMYDFIMPIISESCFGSAGIFVHELRSHLLS